MHEYVTNLRENQKLKMQRKTVMPQIGDIVLIYDDKLPRSRWRIGKIEELPTGDDGMFRSAVLRVKSGVATGIMRRPIC